MRLDKLDIDIYGTSHAAEIGVKVTGFPEVKLDTDYIQKMLDRRRPSASPWSTPRPETDKAEIVFKDGIFTAKITNNYQRSSDYDKLKGIPRPSHADYAAYMKFGPEYDMSGGGKFSGRMTAPLTAAGAMAKYILETQGVKIGAYIRKIGSVRAPSYRDRSVTVAEIEAIDAPLRAFGKVNELIEEVEEARANNDSVGGMIECVVEGYPVGVGDALFEGLEGRLAYCLFAIPAVKAVEFGKGTDFAQSKASTSNDFLAYGGGKVFTETNNSGGINGGISNGMPITMRITFKPVPSIAKKQRTVNLLTQENTEIEIIGRHDACIVPRAIAPVEACVALALLDALL